MAVSFQTEAMLISPLLKSLFGEIWLKGIFVGLERLRNIIRCNVFEWRDLERELRKIVIITTATAATEAREPRPSMAWRNCWVTLRLPYLGAAEELVLLGKAEARDHKPRSTHVISSQLLMRGLWQFCVMYFYFFLIVNHPGCLDRKADYWPHHHQK